MTAALTALLARPSVAATLRTLIAEGAPIEAQIEVLTREADGTTASGVASEFRELPRLTAATIIQAWHLADADGKPFELVSERPRTPLDFARTRRVRITVDSEADVVRVALSHVPGRHAPWYAPRP
jgi:hypothetical protein